MLKDDEKNGDAKNDYTADGAQDEQWPGIDSVFRLIIVAAHRAKQLRRGALPRVAVDPKRQRHTYVALEEVKQGKVRFETNDTNRLEAEPSRPASDEIKINRVEVKAMGVEQSWLV